VSGYFMADDGGEFAGTVNLLLQRNPKERIKLEDLLKKWPSEEALGGASTRTLIKRLASKKWTPGEEETVSVSSDPESSSGDSASGSRI
jgi:hypothetical protein